MTQKLPQEQVVQQEILFLRQQPNIQDVTELPGGNLFVHFKGGYPLIMFLGQDTLGGPVDLQSDETTLPTLNKNATGLLNPGLLNPSLLQPGHPGSNNALIFDCLDDDAWAIQHVSTVDVGADLQAMGYNVTTELNDDASVANATQFANGNYGVVYVRAHGGVLPGNDFGFLMRPWSSSPMPWDSGYTGTWPVSFDSYATGSAVTMYGYATSSEFASAYWTQPFPGTMFFLESCQGTKPDGVPGLPTWTLNHGAGAWIGFDDDVSFTNGDNGSKLFFSDMAKWDDASTGVSDVESAGYLPPNLKLLPAGEDYTLNNRVTGVTINGPRILNLTVGATSTLTATVAPSDAYNTAVTWSSDNTGVATVDPNSGLVTAVAAGYAHITATTVGTWSSGYPSADSITVDVTKGTVIPGQFLKTIPGLNKGILNALAVNFVVSAPTSAVAGTPFSFTVTAQQYDTTDTGYSGTVSFTSDDQAASLPPFKTLTNGTGTFNAIMKTAGNQTITATDASNPAITGSATIAVSAATGILHPVNILQ